MTSDETRDEFKRAVADVEPLRRRKRVELKRPAAAPVPRQRQRDEAAALAESLEGPLSVDDALDTGEALIHLREGMSRETLRQLRRGHWAIEDSVDLHGLNRGAAAAMVVEFLNQCAARRLRCVRIVHGKGLGILRAKLDRKSVV